MTKHIRPQYTTISVLPSVKELLINLRNQSEKKYDDWNSFFIDLNDFVNKTIEKEQ